MKKAKKRGIILGVVCLVILAGCLIADAVLSTDYLVEIKYKEVMKKIDNKESFVLLLSQTTCSHCADYKPKLREVAKKYRVKIYYLEVDLLSEKQDKNLKKHFNYGSTPTTVFVVKGDEKTAATRIVGDAEKKKIINKLKSNGYIK